MDLHLDGDDGIEIDVLYPPPFSLAPDKQAREPGLPSGCRQSVVALFFPSFFCKVWGLCRDLLRLVSRQAGAIPRPLQHAPPPRPWPLACGLYILVLLPRH